MDNIVDELLKIERRCNRGAALIEADEISRSIVAIKDAADDLGRSWSGSWLGYQSRVYYNGFQPTPAGATFSLEWGLMRTGFVEATVGGWQEYSFTEVADETLRRAGSPNLTALQEASDKAKAVFVECKEELQSIFDAMLADTSDEKLQESRKQLVKIEPILSTTELANAFSPKGEFVSRDMRAMGEGKLRTPPHLHVKFQAMLIESPRASLLNLAKAARQTRLYLEKRMSMKGKSVARTEGTIFIGHGRSAAWRDLKDFIKDRLGLRPDEFDLEPAAGLSTVQRLEEMLDAAVFAFLVMTAEDQHADNSKHARENVIHEVGLFQGRLGFRRAIVLLEADCEEFSNIKGLIQIRFPKGNIMAKSEDIRRVLEREGLLK